MKSTALTAIAILGVVGWSGQALAQSESTEALLRRLEAKVDALAKENAALRERVKRVEAPRQAAASPAATPAASAGVPVVSADARTARADGMHRGGLKDIGCHHLFQGFYVGLHGGYTSFTSNQDDHDFFAAGLTGSDKGFSGGAQVGYNHQPSCHTLFGLEADWSWADLSANSQFVPNLAGIDIHINTKLNSFGTLRARSGLVVDNMLLYLTGGLAFADIDVRHRLLAAPINDSVTFSDTRWGWTAGVGVEWALWSNVTLKSEVLYMNFGDSDNTYTSAAVGNPRRNITTDDSLWVTRIGLNFKFGDWGKAPVSGPVSAKY